MISCSGESSAAAANADPVDKTDRPKQTPRAERPVELFTPDMLLSFLYDAQQNERARSTDL
jgi:hypothetical protein